MDLRWNQLYLGSGNPAGLAITGTGDGSDNAWMTSNLIGYYNNNEQSYVLGPLFRFHHWCCLM